MIFVRWAKPRVAIMISKEESREEAAAAAAAGQDHLRAPCDSPRRTSLKRCEPTAKRANLLHQDLSRKCSNQSNGVLCRRTESGRTRALETAIQAENDFLEYAKAFQADNDKAAETALAFGGHAITEETPSGLVRCVVSYVALPILFTVMFRAAWSSWKISSN